MPELQDRILFAVEGLSQTLRVARLFGQEALSELYRFELTVVSDDPALGFDDVVGSKALITMRGDGGDERHVHGIVSRFEQGDAGKKLSSYHATVVPLAARLQHRQDCRIFQDLATAAIVEKVLTGAGLASTTDFRFAVQGTPRKREYCVQYRESDWAFVSRLLEEDGIFYFFEHAEDGHVLVIADAPSVHVPIAGDATVPFRPAPGALTTGEHVARFSYAERVATGKVTLRDYAFKKPSLLLEGAAEAPAGADLERYDYPGLYEESADGTALAKVRLEQQQVSRKVAEGASGCARLIPGSTFTLSEHARESFNRAWLITRVEHRSAEPIGGEAGQEVATYENLFQVIPSDVPYRAPDATPKPTVRGLQSAVVVGPAGEEIYTDAHGRVKVQFHWDRLGKKDDKSSCWLRVAQVSAGAAWGAVVLPRIDQEVLVDFLEGDPDRPIVVGCVYHGTNVPPYALPGEKTKSTFKTRSTPGGEGWNELRFEDKKGSEEIYLHGQKDWTIAIENDKNQTVGHDESLTVGNDRAAKVGRDEALSVARDQTFSVGRDRVKTVTNDETETISGNRTIEVGKDHTESIAGSLAVTVGKASSLDVTEDSNETIGKNKFVKVASDYELEVTANATSKIGGSSTVEVELESAIKVGSKIVLECGEAKVTVEKSGKITISGKSLEVTASDAVKVEAAKVEVKSSGDVKVEASGKVEVKGSGPMELNASGAVKVKGANVGIN